MKPTIIAIKLKEKNHLYIRLIGTVTIYQITSRLFKFAVTGRPIRLVIEGLTYRIIGGNAIAGQAVRSAIDDWTRNIDGLKFTQLDSSDNSADITLKFNSKFSQDGNVRHMKLV